MSDAEIIAGFLSPDALPQKAAIGALHDQIKAPLIHYVRANSGTSQEAIDLMQEVIVVLYQLVKKPDFALKPGTKLSTLAQSIGRDLWLKELRRIKTRGGDNILDGERNEPVEMDTPLDVLTDSERLAIAWKAFDGLGRIVKSSCAWPSRTTRRRRYRPNWATPTRARCACKSTSAWRNGRIFTGA